MSATEFLLRYCDGKLTDDDLNDAGNEFASRFASRYYGDGGLYLPDYAEHFGDLMYVAPETDHDFEKFSGVLDHRYRSGDLTA